MMEADRPIERTPDGQIKIRFGPIEPHIDPPDQICEVCEVQRPFWSFPSKFDEIGLPAVCVMCMNGWARLVQSKTTYELGLFGYMPVTVAAVLIRELEREIAKRRTKRPRRNPESRSVHQAIDG